MVYDWERARFPCQDNHFTGTKQNIIPSKCKSKLFTLYKSVQYIADKISKLAGIISSADATILANSVLSNCSINYFVVLSYILIVKKELILGSLETKSWCECLDLWKCKQQEDGGSCKRGVVQVLGKLSTIYWIKNFITVFLRSGH